MSFRRGDRRDGSRYNYPLGRGSHYSGNENHVPQELDIVRLERVDNPIERAIDIFGITEDKNLGSYILPDGRMLDFSGGDPTKSHLHGDIEMVYGDSPHKDINIPKKMQFVNETGSLEFAAEGDLHLRASVENDITLAQRRKLGRLLKDCGNKVWWDITDERGHQFKFGGGFSLGEFYREFERLRKEHKK